MRKEGGDMIQFLLVGLYKRSKRLNLPGVFVLLLTLLSSINVFSQLNATFSNKKDACDGLNNGSIEITVTGSSGVITVDFLGPPNVLGLNPTDGVPLNVPDLTPRTYLVIVQDDVEAKAFAIEIFDILTPLTASLNSTTDNTDCTNPNGAITINVGGGTGAYSYSWTSPDGFTATTKDISGLLGGSYTIEVFDDGTNCTRVLLDIPITNPAVVVQTITTPSPLAVCPSIDAIITLGASEVGKTYEILVNGVASGSSSPGDVLGGSISITLPSGNFADGDILTVEGFEGVCPRFTMSGSVTISMSSASVAPTSATVDNASYCDDAAPANIVLSSVGGNLGTGGVERWYDDAPFTNLVGVGPNLSLSAPLVNTTYYVRFEGTCNTTTGQSVTVTVDNASVAPTSATVDNTTYCNDAAPANITLTAVGGSLGTGATEQWYDDAAFTSSVGSGSPLILAAPLVTTTYFVRYEGICGSTTGQSVAVVVEIASVAPTSATVDNASYCDDAAPANIVLSSVGGSLGTGGIERWYDDALFTNLVGVGPNLSLTAPLVNTTYYVRFEGTCNTTTGQSVTVTVDNASVAPTSATVDNTTYCNDAAPANITLTAVGGSLGTGATEQWYDDAAFTSSVGSGSPLILIAPLVSTTYFVRYEGICGSTTGQSVAVVVEIASVAPTGATVDNASYCDDAAPANIVLSSLGGSLGTGGVERWYDDAPFTNLVGVGPNLSLSAPLVNTTYYVRFEGTCNATTGQSVTVTVDNASVAPTSASVDNSAYCDDNLPVGGINLSYAGGSLGTGATAEWYDDAGFTSNVGSGNNLNISPPPSVTTTYFVRYEGICGNTTTQNVTVTVSGASVAPTSASVDSPTYCDDVIPTNITLTYAGGSLGTGATAEWYDDVTLLNNIGSGNNLSLTAPGASTTYYVRFEGACNTTADESVTVTVDNASVAPTSATVNNTTYCNDAAPANITLTAVGGSLGTGATEQWYDDAAFTSSVGSGSPLILTAPLVTTTYFVRYEGICGSTTGQSVAVVVEIASVAPTSATVDNASYCDDAAPANIVLSSVGGSLGTGGIERWYDDALFTNLVGVGPNLSLTAPLVNTTYYVRFEGTCNTTTGQSVTVTVDNASVAPTSASVDIPNFCDDAPPANIVLSSVGGSLGTGGVENWYDDASFTNLVGVGPGLNLPAPLTTTTYFVRFEGTCNTTSGQSVVVTVDNASVAPTSATVDNASYCDDAAPTNITLTYAGGSLGTGSSAEWYDDATLLNNVGSGNNLSLAAPNATTTFYVRFEGTCNTTVEQNVTVTVDNASVAPTSATVDLAIYCANAGPTNITLSYVGGSLGSGATAEWYDDAVFTNSVGSGNNLSLAAPTTSTTYFVRFEGTCGNTSDQFVLVDVIAPPSASITGALAACENSTESYSVPAGEAAYSWTLTGGDGVITSGAGTPVVTIDWGGAGGDLSVTVTGLAPTSCVSTSTETIGVFSTLPALADQTTATCQNSTFPTLVASPLPGATVSWYQGSSSTGPLITTGDTFTPTASELDLTTPGVTIFTYTQDIGCLVSPDASYEVTVEALPNAGTNNTIATCGTDAPIDLFTLLGGTPDTGGTWTDDDSAGGLTNGIFDPTISGEGIFNFTYQVDGQGTCSGQSVSAIVTVSVSGGVSGELGVIVSTYPEQDIGAIEVINITSDDLPIEISLEDDAMNVIFDWTVLEADRLGEYSFTFTLLPQGNYVVMLRDAAGCDLALPQTIGLEQNVFIPNVITPNGDGFNEFFKVLNKTPNTQIVISNRWGIKVFESNDYQNDWFGEGLPDGVYFYSIKMAGVVYQGNVEVWRNDGSGSN
jgi:gliding motility-associated-like protein